MKGGRAGSSRIRLRPRPWLWPPRRPFPIGAASVKYSAGELKATLRGRSATDVGLCLMCGQWCRQVTISGSGSPRRPPLGLQATPPPARHLAKNPGSPTLVCLTRVKQHGDDVRERWPSKNRNSVDPLWYSVNGSTAAVLAALHADGVPSSALIRTLRIRSLPIIFARTDSPGSPRHIPWNAGKIAHPFNTETIWRKTDNRFCGYSSPLAESPLRRALSKLLYARHNSLIFISFSSHFTS
ncbi:hypothetical protein BS78_10G148300 [Paspalum vaginatum]|nr:hypothetical protein BS78_10G148300 [Paspalum vaginatum]